MYYTVIGFNICFDDFSLVNICLAIKQGDKGIRTFSHMNDLAIGEVSCINFGIYKMIPQNVSEFLRISVEIFQFFLTKCSECVIGGSKKSISACADRFFIGILAIKNFL